MLPQVCSPYCKGSFSSHLQPSAWADHAATCIRVHISRHRRAPRLGFCAGRPLPTGAASPAGRLRSACFARAAAVAVRSAVILRARAGRPAPALRVTLHATQIHVLSFFLLSAEACAVSMCAHSAWRQEVLLERAAGAPLRTAASGRGCGRCRTGCRRQRTPRT